MFVNGSMTHCGANVFASIAILLLQCGENLGKCP